MVSRELIIVYCRLPFLLVAYIDYSGGCFPLQHDLCIIFDLVFDILPHSFCFLLFIFTPFFGSLALFFFIFCFSFFLPFFLFFPSSFNQRLCESRKKVYGINAYYTMYARVCESSNIFCSLFVIGAKLWSTLRYQISSLTLRTTPYRIYNKLAYALIYFMVSLPFCQIFLKVQQNYHL